MTRANPEQVHPTVAIAVNATGLDVPDVANRARAHKCNSIELAVDPPTASEDWDAIRAGLGANNLTCTGLALVNADASLGAGDAGSRSRARERIMSAIHDARRVGATYIRIVTARLDAANTPAPRHEEAYHHALDALLSLRHEAGLNGIRLVIHLAEHGFLTSPPEARRFLDAVNSPWVGGTINLGSCGSSALATDWIETLTHRLTVVLMEGTVKEIQDWSAIGRALAAERFDGYLVAPIDVAHDIDNRIIMIRQALGSLPPPD